ncbi:hypothetical protein ACFZCL_14810 [Streptomyces sp. NPDC008159]|uniref:hypothetical protein n=1 Tax=Streptomyces sp. NPDC008159 TaxID=3364817 RepID=UPI0036E6A1E3
MEAAVPIGYIGVAWVGTDETTGGGIRPHDADGDQGTWMPLGDGGCSVANRAAC